MNPDDSIKMRRARKVVDNGTGPFAIPLAQLTEAIITNDKLDALTESIKAIEMPEAQEIELPEYPTEITVSNLPEVQKVVVTNFPEQKAPIVNVSAPVVNVEAQEAQEIDVTPIAEEVAKIREMLIKEDLKEEDKVDFERLFKELGDKVEKIKSGGFFGGGSSMLQIAENTVGVKYLTGSSTNGQVELTSANTWYAVPSTVPSSPYVLVVTQETASGTIRWGFDNTGTPSATNGNQAPNQLTVKLNAGQVIYYASSTSLDGVNWTTKII